MDKQDRMGVGDRLYRQHQSISAVTLYLEFVNVRGAAIEGVEMNNHKFWQQLCELTVRSRLLFQSRAINSSLGIIDIDKHRFALFFCHLQCLRIIPERFFSPSPAGAYR